MRSEDFDVSLPSAEDFPVYDISAQTFVESVKLSINIGKIAQLSIRESVVSGEELSLLTASLCNWLAELPADLHLYDSIDSRREFNGAVVELHIMYFVAIILLQALYKGQD